MSKDERKDKIVAAAHRFAEEYEDVMRELAVTDTTDSGGDWEREFDAHFPEYFEGAYYEEEDVNLGDELKDFIRSLLAQQRQEEMQKVRELIERLKLATQQQGTFKYDAVYNEVLDNLPTLFDNK